MATVSIANTDAGLSGKTIDLLESDQTITGLKTFSRGAQSPFAVAVGSTKVANLDADLLDGVEAAAFYKIDGTVTLTAGIPFPAVQVASAGANVLDDYKEGTWTPTDASGASLVFTTPVGQYVKVGQLVHVWGAVTYPATASGANAIIGGLPFTALAFANGGYPGTVGFYNGTLDIYTYISPGTANVLFYKNTGAAILNSDQNGRTVYFSGMYRASA